MKKLLVITTLTLLANYFTKQNNKLTLYYNILRGESVKYNSTLGIGYFHDLVPKVKI